MYRVSANVRTFMQAEAPWPVTLAAAALSCFAVFYAAAAILGGAS